MIPSIHDSVTESFSFTQDKVILFAELSGDKNPLHLDEEYAKTTIFGKPIIHGFLGGSVFSKMLASNFWGKGTIYLQQDMKFLKPMYVNELYKATLTINDIKTEKNIAFISTQITTTAGDLVTIGTSTIKFPKNKK